MKTSKTTLNHSIAACAFEISATNDRIQLFPAGKFRAIDGRPTDVAHWFTDAAVAQQLISALSVRKNPVVIDYEHQTLRTGENGQPAPAAGWMNGSKIVWEPGGLFADGVEWTSRARELIKNREYRYISPVFTYDRRTGAVQQLIHAALTNDPGLDGMSEVTLAAASRLAALTTTETLTVNEELLKLLRQLLGLPDDADEAAITAALEKMAADLKPVTDADGNSIGLSSLLASVQEKDTKIAGLTVAIEASKKRPDPAKVPAGNPDPSKFVPVEVVTQLTQDLAALSARVNGSELDTIVTEALKAGKLLPALEPWARELGAKDLAALKSYVSAAAPIAALTTTQTGGKAPTGEDAHGLTPVELEAAALSGITPKDFAATKKSME